MAYDPIAAHEYYINYVKKGKLKGRSKGKKKKTTLKGASTAGLNEAGVKKVNALKADLTEKMKAEMLKVFTSEEKAAIKEKYQAQIKAEVAKIKENSAYKKASKKKTSKKKKSVKASLKTLDKKITTMSDEQKAEVKQLLTDILNQLKGSA